VSANQVIAVLHFTSERLVGHEEPATISLSRRGRAFHLNQFQFDRFCVASLQVYRDALFFRIFQEVRIFPLALFHTGLDGKEAVQPSTRKCER
jgi:hypothetical protein